MHRSTRRALAALLLTPLLLASAALARGDDAPLPAAETLLEKHVEATGGRAAHLALRTRRREGKLAFKMSGHEFDCRVVEQFRAPDESHTLYDGDAFSQVTVCDGENAWEWRPGQAAADGTASAGDVRLLEGIQKTRTRDKARMHGALDWKRRFVHVETLARVEVRGQPAYQVQLETPSGERYTQCYDVASGRLVRRTRDTEQHGQVTRVVAEIDDYREFDGVWLPMKVSAFLSAPGQEEGTQVWTYERVVHGVELPDSLFAAPPELAAELERARQTEHGKAAGGQGE